MSKNPSKKTRRSTSQLSVSSADQLSRRTGLLAAGMAMQEIFNRHHMQIIIPFIFFTALLLRFILLLQIKDSPYFTNPIGDAAIYYERALRILAGDWQGSEIPFHSSPIYPFMMAAVFKLTDQSFFALRFFQILIGSLNCVLVYLLARLVLPVSWRAWAIVAGLSAAGYGLLAFFDVDLLMIFFTLTALTAGLLLLIQSGKKQQPVWAALAGWCIGLAVLDKTNIVLTVPVMIWYLADFSKHLKRWPWQKISFFLAGLFLTILPVTINNYLLEKDFVPVASNAGVNLYIGNHRQAEGMFQLPASSGLSNLDLGGSSVQVAEQALKRSLKPSEVSGYWTEQALDWLVSHPWDALKLYYQKFILMWNAEEIPNHLNYKFIRAEFAPVLHLLVIGFGVMSPLGVAGLLGSIRSWQNHDKLLAGCLALYVLSLLPFFITARYRLPLVPILLAYVPLCLATVTDTVRQRKWKSLLVVLIIILGTSLFVHQRPHQVMTYTHNRVAVAGTYLERAVRHKATGHQDIEKAIVEFKRALEVEPTSEDAHYNLGRAYEAVGFYSGARRHFETVLALNPRRKKLKPLITLMKQKEAATGDLISPRQLPLTLFEAARAAQQSGRNLNAIKLYRKVINRDPYHLQAYNQLAAIHRAKREFRQAINLYRQALHYQPKHFILMNNLAGTYYQAGRYHQAKRWYQKCLRIKPDSELIRKQMKKVEAKLK